MSQEEIKEANTAAESNDATTFAKALIQQVNKEDINSMVHIQKDMLSRFEKTNEMLINFNILSTGRFDITFKEFQKHTNLVFEMKKDLDAVFKRIRILKQRLGKTYPEAFAACSSIYAVTSEEDDSEEECVVQVPYEAADTREMATSTTELKLAQSNITDTDACTSKQDTTGLHTSDQQEKIISALEEHNISLKDIDNNSENTTIESDKKVKESFQKDPEALKPVSSKEKFADSSGS